MNQTTAPVRTNKLIVRIKVPSDIDAPMLDTSHSNNKLVATLSIAMAILTGIGLAFWFWNSEQNDPTTKLINSTQQISPTPAAAKTTQNVLTDTPEINEPTSAEVTPSQIEQSNTKAVIETDTRETENKFETITTEVPTAANALQQTPLKTTQSSAQSLDIPEDKAIAKQKLEQPAEAILIKPSITTQTTAVKFSKNVTRAVFSHQIKNREPVNQIEGTIKAKAEELKQVYFFSELRDMKGTKIIHRWLYNRKKQAEIPFNINGNRWRVFSSKRIVSTKTGEWQVDIVNSKTNTVIASRTFTYSSSQ